MNQEEILRVISESSFETGVKRGSKAHLTRFACEYADYLSQLRKNVSRGILGMVEKEIRENYASNITLKSLSEKYYVNSAYLGQLFRKKYGQSFKDYLNNYRMEQAADALLRTDKRSFRSQKMWATMIWTILRTVLFRSRAALPQDSVKDATGRVRE